jgi:hypothetical protein
MSTPYGFEPTGVVLTRMCAQRLRRGREIAIGL